MCQNMSGLSTAEVEFRKKAGLSNESVDSSTKTVAQIIRSNVVTYYNLIFLIITILLIVVGSFRDLTFLPIIIANMLIVTAFERLHSVISIHTAIISSNTAIIVESAANDINTKNKNPHTLPPAILLNTFGRVINNNEGPLSGLTPYEKHAGIMINPAIRATNVSSSTMLIASPVSERFLSR